MLLMFTNRNIKMAPCENVSDCIDHTRKLLYFYEFHANARSHNTF